MRVLDLSQLLGVECDLGYNLRPIIHTFYATKDKELKLHDQKFIRNM